MPIETQGKIVRVLQEQKFIRVGGDKEVHVNVRVISSTNKNLQEEIANRAFQRRFILSAERCSHASTSLKSEER